VACAELLSRVDFLWFRRSTVVIKNILENTQAFLQGHTDKVTCIAVSRDGRRLASGQTATLGQKAPVIVWDVEAGIRNKNTAVTEGELLHQLVLHKGGVRDVAFSPDGDYLATLGGADDNSLVIWEAETGAAICGSPAASHAALTVRWSNTSNTTLVTAGYYNLRLWELDVGSRKVRFHRLPVHVCLVCRTQFICFRS
jgi:cilia- and flagella-associated protein 52